MTINIVQAIQNIDITPEGIAGSLGRLIRPTGEPQKKYMWEVHITNSTTDTGMKDLCFYAKQASIPQSSIDVIERNYMGQKLYYAGKDSSSKTVTITFWDDQNFAVLNYLGTWMNHVNSMWHGRQVSTKDYMRDIELHLKDTTDLFTNGIITLHQAFITELSDIELTYEDSGIFEFTATFQFNHKFMGANRDRDINEDESDSNTEEVLGVLRG